jgi:hypothetical protein
MSQEACVATQQGEPDDAGEGEEVRIDQQGDDGRVDGEERQHRRETEQQHQTSVRDHPVHGSRRRREHWSAWVT